VVVDDQPLSAAFLVDEAEARGALYFLAILFRRARVVAGVDGHAAEHLHPMVAHRDDRIAHRGEALEVFLHQFRLVAQHWR
jgi:hypothetical protein